MQIDGKRAFFSDETIQYRFPMEPEAGDSIKIRFRTGKNGADRICLINGDQKIEMDKESSDDLFDFYQTEVLLGEEAFSYYFDINIQGVHHTYNKKGLDEELSEDYLFSVVPGFSTPDWAKGAVMYQIFTERFCNGDLSNDVKDREYYYIDRQTEQIKEWHEVPENMGVHTFYGGDLQGIINKLDYLKGIGIDVLYLNPIFVSPSNHKYDTQDYDYVDPHFGIIVCDEGEVLKKGEKDNSQASLYIERTTRKENLEASNELFIRLVQEVHARGMKIILDGVFNHCGSFNKWMDRERIYENAEGYEKGAYVSEKSPYRSFFGFKDTKKWPYNSSYEGWWDHATLPKLNYEQSSELEDYIIRIGRKWVSPPYNADGWRLDVAADLGHDEEFNHRFWKRFRKEVKEANPDALILAEHYGSAKEWLQGDQWDTVMNYDAFMEPVTWFLTGMEKHSDEYRPEMLGDEKSFVQAMNHHMSGFLYPSLLVAMNELSNHDHSRFLTRTNHRAGRVSKLGARAAEEGISKAVFKEAAAIQMTWPGAPTLYYGDEAGLCGFTDPDNRRTYPWGKEDHDLLEFYREMIEIHKKYPVLTYGSLKFLCQGKNILCYGRFDEKEQIAVTVNNHDKGVYVTIPVWEMGVTDAYCMERIMMSFEEGFDMAAVHCQVTDGKIRVYLPKQSAAIFKSFLPEEKNR